MTFYGLRRRIAGAVWAFRHPALADVAQRIYGNSPSRFFFMADQRQELPSGVRRGGIRL